MAGPGLLAFSLMMVAFSLRTWRRNGVACDELLFLPDTRHAEAVESSTAASITSSGNNNNLPPPPPRSMSSSASEKPSTVAAARNEGDVSAGGWAPPQAASNNISSDNQHRGAAAASSTQQALQDGVGGGGNDQQELTIEMIAGSVPPRGGHARSLSGDSSLSSIREFADSWDEEDQNNNNEQEQEMVPLNQQTNTSAADGSTSTREQQQQRHFDRDNSMGERSMHAVHSSVTVPTRHPYTRAERFRENHPQITRIGSFFFFRTGASSVENAAYAPSGPSVMGAALDLCMPVLFNFHLFIEAWNHLDAYETETPAKILPLIFLSVLIVRTSFPPGRRGRFWSTMRCTAAAPFRRSRFRDVFLGDVLTSLVRPLQDVVFALAYYVTVVWGTVTAKYDLSESGDLLETSWILHNVVLPSCALMPLWWKFLQTLRESYDTGKRWPYLGNAFKYLSAALVILYGMTHPENRRSPWWILAFGLALAYQIFWDTVMDWELFVIGPPEGEVLDGWTESSPWFSAHSISSVRPTSYWVLALQRLILPIRECVRSRMARCPSYKQIRLRQRRLYKSDIFYWRIFMYNCVFRFCWMLSFIPAYHLSPNGRDVVTTFSSDTKSYVGVLLPVAEIFRRTLWGFLFVEMQTIKMSEGNPAYGYAQVQTETEDDEFELSSSDSRNSKLGPRHYLPAWLGTQQQLQHEAAQTSASPWWKISSWFQCDEATREKLFFAELVLWATAFVGLGMWACT